ncbi:MAG: 3'-5' exonuclease [Psychroflexus sp.]|nr:3'-5' exonuclease [Psychroflexus sp.]MDR9449361.1 3'-5' exonuclease [Psychroflexus sp.]
MIHKIPIDNILFLDIETVPQYRSFSDLPEYQQQLYADKTRYQRKDDISAEDFYQKAGIWAEFGKIVCISAGFIAQKGNESQLRITSFHGEEQNILTDFTQLLEEYFNQPQSLLCAHNGKEFDFPYIARRMLINGMALPNKLQLFGKKPWEVPHIDTLELWKFGDYKHYTSLKLLASVFGIPSPKDDIDGSQVRDVFYEEQNIDRIITYCEKDVVTLVQVFLKMRNEQLLDEHQIKIV